MTIGVPWQVNNLDASPEIQLFSIRNSAINAHWLEAKQRSPKPLETPAYLTYSLIRILPFEVQRIVSMTIDGRIALFYYFANVVGVIEMTMREQYRSNVVPAETGARKCLFQLFEIPHKPTVDDVCIGIFDEYIRRYEPTTNLEKTILELSNHVQIYGSTRLAGFQEAIAKDVRAFALVA